MKNIILPMAVMLIILATACEPEVEFVLPLSPTQMNLPTPSIKTPRVNPICIDAHPNWAGEGNIDRQLALAKEAGVYWMRFDFPWDQIETSFNVWDFTKFDYIVDQARLDGIHIIATITQYDVPGWRNGNQTKDYPASSQDYAMFVGKIAEHFKGRILLYELGNEPDNPLFWQPAPDVVKFTQFLKKGYAVIKGIDPSARVISGGLTSQNQTGFVTAMYANGAKGSFDYFGYHPQVQPAIGQEPSPSSSMVTKYQKRISGPLLDRIDIHIQVPRVDYDKLSDRRMGEPSKNVRERVEAARERQRARFASLKEISCNADMRPAEVRKFCELDAACTSLMKTAMSQLQLSARAYHRVLKLARTIADLAGSERIGASHLAEALQYRPRMTTDF